MIGNAAGRACRFIHMCSLKELLGRLQLGPLGKHIIAFLSRPREKLIWYKSSAIFGRHRFHAWPWPFDDEGRFGARKNETEQKAREMPEKGLQFGLCRRLSA